MTPELIESYQVMQYINTLLLCIVGALFVIIGFFLKKEIDTNKGVLKIHDDLHTSHTKNIDAALAEIKFYREDTNRIIKIIAKHTGANIGALVIGVSIVFY